MKNFFVALWKNWISQIIVLFIGIFLVLAIWDGFARMTGGELKFFSSDEPEKVVDTRQPPSTETAAPPEVETLVADYAGKLLQEKTQNGSISKEAFTKHTTEFLGNLVITLASEPDEVTWRFEVEKAPPPYEGAIGHDLGIKFISSKGVVVTPQFRNPYRICFMKILCDSGNGKMRRYDMDFADEITDYKQYLLDMKGDGDRRHLIVCNYEGGNSGAQYQAFLIDVKDGFKILKEIPAGECPDYPIYNPELKF